MSALLRIEDDKGKHHVIALGASLRIGRSTRSDLVLKDGATSRRHAELRELSPGHYILLAFKSRNGTRVNGTLVRGMHKLSHGDVIQIGKARLQFELAEGQLAGEATTGDSGSQTAAGFQDGFAVILMSDIRNYTAMTARFAGQRFQALVGLWFERVIAVLETRGATIDKIMGDAVMAYWFSARIEECRLDVGRAIEAACEMVHLMHAHDREVRRQFPEAEFRIGIGLNAGAVSLGNVGTANHQAMTVLGDCVNLTARLEALSKDTGRLVIAGCDFVRMAPPGASFSDLGQAAVRGHEEPLSIHALDLPARTEDP